MELGELVDHFRTIYLDDVSNQVEGQPDELFGQESIVRLIQAAQDEFARRTWCIIDDEGSVTIDADHDGDTEEVTVTTIDLTAYDGLQKVTYSDRIVRVIRARFSDTSIPLPITGFGYSEPGIKSPYANMRPWDVNETVTLSEGRPTSIFLDADTHSLKFDRPLDEDTAALELKLRVARKSILVLNADYPTEEPEIPEDYHLALLDYVGKEILKGPNVDAAGARLRAQYAQEWEKNVVAAKREMRRRMQGTIGWRFGAWGRGCK